MPAEIVVASMLAILIALIVLGVPIGMAMSGVGILFGFIFVGPQVASLFFLRIFGVFQDYVLVAVPLFVMMGIAIERAGLAEKLYDAMYVIFGNLRGGLLIATILVGTLFAAATGVIAASIVAMGLIALPTMLKYNYDKSIATGAICAGGTLGILIPPSVMIVLYGPMAGLSVARLFMGAFTPGLLLSALYIIYVIALSAIKPSMAPAMPKEEFEMYSFRDKLTLFVSSVLPVAALIIAVLGSIFFGLAAPTEAAGVGAFLAFVLAASYKKLNFKNLKEILIRTVRTTSMIYFVLVGAGFFTGTFLRLGGARVVSDFMLGLPFGTFGAILVMLAVVFILGMFLDWIGIIMIVVPLFTPIAETLGVNAIWFALMVMLVLQTSFLSPPFAYSIFFLKGVSPSNVYTSDIYRGVWPFILIQLLAILVCAALPELITWLPDLMYN